MNGALLKGLQERLAQTPDIDRLLALTREVMEANHLNDEWLCLFDDDTLVLSQVSPSQVDAAGNIRFDAKAAFLQMENVPVVVTFFESEDPTGAEEDRLECLLRPSGLPQTWSLAPAYPALPGYLDYAPDRIGLGWQDSFLRDAAFRDVDLFYSSFDFSADEGRDLAPRRCSLTEAPRLRDRVLRAGINLVTKMECVGDAWTAVRALLAPHGGLDRLDAFGTISDEGGPMLRLAHSLVDPATGKAPGLSVSGAGAFTLALKEVWLSSGLDSYGQMPAVSLRASIETADLAVDLDIAFSIGSPTASIAGSFGGTPLTLPKLERVLGLESMAPHLPGPLETFGGLGLERLEADLALSPPGISRVGFVFTTEHPWTIVEGIISVLPVFTFTRTSGEGDPETTVEITGDWLLGGTRFETFVSPSTGDFAAYMANGESLDVGAVIEKFLPGVERPNCAVIDLDLYGNYLDDSVGFDLETHGGWTFHLGGTDLSITDIAISGEYDTRGFTAKLTGTFGIGGWLARVDVELQEQVSFSVMLPEVNVTELLDDLLAFVAIPAELPDFDIQNLAINVTPSTGAFDISGDSNSDIHLFPGFDFQLVHFSASREAADGDDAPKDAATPAGMRVKAGMQWRLQLGPATILLSADYKSLERAGDPESVTTEWTFRGALQQNLPLGALITALETLVHLDYPLPIGDLEITHLQIGFNIGAKERYFVLSCAVENAGKSYGKISVFAEKTLAEEDKVEPKWRYTLNLEADLDLALTDLPLVGPQLAQVAAVRISGLEITKAPHAYSEEEVGTLQLRLPDGAAAPPAKALHKGLNVQTQMWLGSPDPIVLGVPLDASAQGGDAGGPVITVPSAAADADASAATKQTAIDETKWFQVDKALGAACIERVGMRFRNSELLFLLDAYIHLGPFRIGFAGLGAGSKLDRFSPTFDLEGMSLDYSSGALEISGGFLRLPSGAFAGEVRIEAAKFALTALGQYGNVDGHTSLIVFGALKAPLGGPPYFFVEGLAVGMGYNSRINLPTVDRISRFSLIRAILPGQDPFGEPDDAGAVLRAMEDDMSMVYGGQWMAAGLRFSTNKMINSVALAIVNIGHKLEIELIGLSQASMPPMSPDPVAFVELAFQATCDPDAGLLAFSAKLTPNSYVFSRSAHLLGGMAFYSWFAGEHEGDFIFSLGGYHPRFNRPSHYPPVDRLALIWQVSNCLSIKGTNYFAMTPRALMAGGSLEAVWSAGDLRAWFTAEANFIIFWEPFAYEADFACTIGVSYRLNLLFTSVTISVHVSVRLMLQGPPFAGRADIDLSVVSFSISFGDSTPDPQPIPWQRFKESFLPVAADRVLAAAAGDQPARIASTTVCTITPVAGLMRDLSKEARPDGLRWLFNPGDFSLSTGTVIPIKAATFNDKPGKQGSCRTDFGVSPAGVAPGNFESTHHVALRRSYLKAGSDQVFEEVYDLDRFDAAPITRNVPAALWSSTTPSRTSLDGAALIDDALTGFTIVPKPFVPDHTRPFAVAKLQYEEASAVQPFAWNGPAVPGPNPYQATVSGAREELLAVTLPGGEIVQNTEFVLQAVVAAKAQQSRASLIAAMIADGLAVSDKVAVDRFGRSTMLTDWPAIRCLGED